ncbi:hypothetical protein QYF61_012321, partial [Mycteria americana]
MRSAEQREGCRMPRSRALQRGGEPPSAAWMGNLAGLLPRYSLREPDPYQPVVRDWTVPEVLNGCFCCQERRWHR